MVARCNGANTSLVKLTATNVVLSHFLSYQYWEGQFLGEEIVLSKWFNAEELYEWSVELSMGNYLKKL